MVADEWNINKDDFDLYLYWAAYLTEIGLDISHSNYQKHGAYILENADLIGFSRQEQQLLATLVLAHRRKIPLKAFKSLPKHLQKPAQRLAVLLRLSCILHRSRNPDAVPAFHLSAKGKTIRVRLDKQWLEDHRLTEADLQQEATYLQDAGLGLELDISS
jgi:exopolyphosphatase/guanosine-5'-triphosphate,3'-diphosphate pyrophosphatase